MPLLYHYVGREPLHEALPEAEHLGADRVAGRDCEIFRFAQVEWTSPQDLVYHLDKETSIPLKVESFRDRASFDAGKPLWVWTADKLERVDGHPVVRDSTQVDYAAGGAEPAFTRTFRVESIAFDKDYPASTFWPVFQPGVGVLDVIAGKSYREPGADPEAEVDASASRGGEAATTTAQPLQAIPPGHWTSTLSTVSLGLGISVLVASLAVVWWRRR